MIAHGLPVHLEHIAIGDRNAVRHLHEKHVAPQPAGHEDRMLAVLARVVPLQRRVLPGELRVVALFEVENYLVQRTEEINRAIEKSGRSRDPATVANGNDPTMQRVLVEMLRQRLSHLGKASQSERRAAYRDAEDPVREAGEEGVEPDPEVLTIIEIIESTEGASSAAEHEVQAAQALTSRIKAAREARVPKEAREPLDVLAAARRTASRARQIFKIRRVRPEEE